MPGERSLYSKIALTLEMAAGARDPDPSKLEAALKRSPVFTSRQYDPASDEFVSRPSGKMARRVLRFCARLGLIDINGSLTPLGRRASIRSKFDAIVSAQVLGMLSDAGADASAVN